MRRAWHVVHVSASDAGATPFDVRHRFSDVCDPCRTILLPPVRHRRQERRVGLHHEPIERTQRCRVAHVLRALERDDAAERQERADVEAAARLGGTSCEAVQAPYAAGGPTAPQHVQRVVPRVARMHHQGEIVVARQFDLRRERVALRGSGRVLVVVVEPALPHRHHDAASRCRARARAARARAPRPRARPHGDAAPWWPTPRNRPGAPRRRRHRRPRRSPPAHCGPVRPPGGRWPRRCRRTPHR